LEEKRLAAEILEARRAEWMNQVRHDGTDSHLPRLKRIVTAFTEDCAQEETEFVRRRHIRRTLPKRADELVVFEDAAEYLSVPYVQAKNHPDLLRRINHEETKSTKFFSGLFFVPFVSSWLILIVSGCRSLLDE